MLSQALNLKLLPLPSSDDLLLTPGGTSVVRQETHMSTDPVGLGLPQSSLCGPLFISLHPALPLIMSVPYSSQRSCDKSHLRRISKTSKMWLYAPYSIFFLAAIHAGQATFSPTAVTCACSQGAGCLSPPDFLFFIPFFTAPMPSQSCWRFRGTFYNTVSIFFLNF